MRELKQRANLDVFLVRDKPLVLYEDHRSLVFVLWHARHVAKTLREPPLLVTFDGHQDGVTPEPPVLAKIKELRAGSPTPRAIFDFVEWDLGNRDDDWLIAGMELGLIGDAISIGTMDRPNFPDFETTHVDHLGGSHTIWTLNHLWDALSPRGQLEDTSRRGELGGMWNALGWDPPRFQTNPASLPPIVSDFDLDCFTAEVCHRRQAWPGRYMETDFGRRPGGSYSARDFLDALEHRIVFRTIARESPYCGGTVESQNILCNLDDVLWDGELCGRR